jgi:hypothetical protein
VTRSGDPEQRIAEALRARSTGAGRGGAALPTGTPPPLWEEAGLNTGGTRLALAAALAAGILIGVIFAVLSLVAPGVLPPLG